MPPLIVAAALLLLTSGSAEGAIIGLLEAPEADASQVSNVQGWVYTNTPGAELIQPFDVFIDGEKVLTVPCCSDRGDVQDLNPDAPLATGFSGVTNWAREAGDSPITVEVVVRDTEGGELTLTRDPVTAYSAAVFPFASNAQWADNFGAASAVDAPQGFSTPRTAWCSLTNDGAGDAAELVCTGLLSHADEELEMCGGTHRFAWVKASQGFKLRSNCEDVPRWLDHGDNTATDMWTGLRWELLTLANVNIFYPWSGSGTAADGSAFTFKLSQANGSGGVGCFAGFCDWRIPTVQELSYIVDSEACAEADVPCTTIPGETAELGYWSNTTHEGDNTAAWSVDFNSGGFGGIAKTLGRRVRLVRGATPAVSDEP